MPGERGRPRGNDHEHIIVHGKLDSHGRGPCQCAHLPCVFQYQNMRSELVWVHVLEHCKGMTDEGRAAVRDQLTSRLEPAAGPKAKRSRGSTAGSLAPKGSPNATSLAKFTPSSGQVTPKLQQELDTKFVRAIVHAGVSFNAAGNCHSLICCWELALIWVCRLGSRMLSLSPRPEHSLLG